VSRQAASYSSFQKIQESDLTFFYCAISLLLIMIGIVGTPSGHKTRTDGIEVEPAVQSLKKDTFSPTAPPTLKGRRTRSHLLNCARRVFARMGYVTLTMSEVAKEAKVSMGALYRYFQNKDDLFVNLVGDIHEDLFQASRAVEHDFAADPYNALLEANRGYLAHYYENRDVMRALMEAVAVDERFRDVWWKMRNRHVERFVHALRQAHGIEQVDGVAARTVTEALASLVEQSAYTWFAQEELNDGPIPVKTVAQVVSGIWYRTFFGDQWNSHKNVEK